MPTIGAILQNRYEVTGMIKSGGMGAIYEVYDRRLGMGYALKEAFVQTSGECALFAQEAQLLARLSHPVLPKVIDHFVEHGQHFLVMELVPGDDLETLLHTQGQPFDIAQVLAWADQLLDALEFLHGQNPPIVHRDIKPANMKPLPGRRIKLLDFGIARQLAPGSQTVAAAKAYSEDYSPLEQFSATGHTDARSDIYALGATLYHLLTNETPPSAPLRAQGTPLLGPSQFNPQITPGLAQVLLRAMALRPEHRFPDTASLRAALRVATQPNVTRRSRGLRIALGIGGAAVLIGLGARGIYMLEQPTLAQPVAALSITSTAPTSATLAPSNTPASVFASQPATEELPSGTATAPPAPAASPTATPNPPTATDTPRISDLSALAATSASSMLPEETLPKLGLVRYDSGNALDRNPATAWVEGASGSGVGEQLVLTFPQPVTLVRLGFSDGSVQHVEFLDQRGMQYLSFAGVTTTKLTIVIDAVYPGTKYDDTCIAEVEIWGYQAQ
jgi:serine/threonine protein kinase